MGHPGVSKFYTRRGHQKTRTIFSKAYTQTVLFVQIFQYKIVQSQDEDSKGSYQKEAMSRKAGASSEAVVQPSDEDSNNFESTMRQTWAMHITLLCTILPQFSRGCGSL